MDVTLEKRIQQQVFDDVGIVIDAKDPVFALAVICKEIIKEDKEGYQQLQKDVILEIRQIPGALSEAVEKVAAAVEDAETTSKALCDVTEKALTALSEKTVQDTCEALQTVTRDQVAVALSQINLSFDALAKQLGSSTQTEKIPMWPLAILASALLGCVLIFPPFIYHQMKVNSGLNQELVVYAKELISLERSVATLPKPTQDALKRFAEKEKASLK